MHRTPRIVSHNGGCCGIRTICGFNYGTGASEADVDEVKRIIQQSVNHAPGHLIEVVLNQQQVTGRLRPLMDMGFKLMTKFYNPTGITCYVLHYCTSARNTNSRAGRGIGKPLFGGPSPEVK